MRGATERDTARTGFSGVGAGDLSRGIWERGECLPTPPPPPFGRNIILNDDIGEARGIPQKPRVGLSTTARNENHETPSDYIYSL